MLNTLEKVVYKAFGLYVTSDIPLPELKKIGEQRDFIDVEITIGNLTSDWGLSGASIKQIFVRENVVMFQIQDTAIFSITEGKSIVVSPLAGFSEEEARLYILGTCMGAILLQRKILPLHGSAVVINGKAYGFVGDSGAGKSTLASAFINNGYQLLTDDVIAVTLSKDDIPLVTPSYPQQKLWQESLNQFGMENHQYRPLLGRETKFAVPVPFHFTAEPIPLAGIFELVKITNEEIEILPIQGLDRLHTLFYHTYRNFMVAPSGLMEWHFNTMARFINKIDLFQLRRPISRFTANDLPTWILNTLEVGK
ncbi:aldolase [Neobacillus sp. MM2021_6]|uniref:aldolase n=1 Tax=Bacillaceae TaxID=186817 RepID=UPI00140DCB09|nr:MULTISPECIES: aldolase [Bacillaceae]MBO0962187.1 aldolase [Neobacillus sp. MM2021_6]NHC19033.1 aldolase [Bacillus sp. MM2020_4]